MKKKKALISILSLMVSVVFFSIVFIGRHQAETMVFLLRKSFAAIELQKVEERLNPPRLEDQLRVGIPDEVGLDEDALKKILDSIETDKHQDLNSVLISKNNVLIFEAYFNGQDRESLHDIRSAGKSFTSTLIGIALSNGSIDNLDQNILSFFPEYLPLQENDERKASISIRHLLEMRSGYDANDWDKDSPGREQRMYYSTDWIRFALNTPMLEEPGKSFKYAGINTFLLGGIIRSSTQTPLHKYIAKELFEPLGITEFHWKKSIRGRALGQGSLYLRSRDMLKFGLLFLNEGRWNQNEIVTSDWVKEATKARSYFSTEKKDGYGYQWWTASKVLRGKEISYFYAAGNGGQRIYVVPALDTVVVVTGSSYGESRGSVRSKRIFEEVLSSIKE